MELVTFNIDMCLVHKAEKIIGYAFRDKGLLCESITHPSCAGSVKMKKYSKNYERLEFLGDAVLGLVTAEILFQLFPKEDEGELASRRTSLIRGKVISEIARDIGISDIILVSNSEKKSSEGEQKSSILENALEAIIGAIYLDGGFGAAREFVFTHWISRAKQSCPFKDPKSKLQEIAQELGMGIPFYHLVDRTGADHTPVFTVEVLLGDFRPALGVGGSKKAAEAKAAESMLKILNIK